MEKRKLKFAAVTAGGLLVVGGGAALASGVGTDPADASREIIERAADELGVAPEELRDALKNAAIEEVDDAVDAGRISERQAESIRDAIESGDGPAFGPWFGGPHLGGPHLAFAFDLLETAADYLGLTEEQLRDRLAEDRSLADVAQDEGKSVDGLIDAVVDARRAELDEAVSEGHITQAQRERIAENLEERIEFFVERSIPDGPGGPRHHFFEGGPFGP